MRILDTVWRCFFSRKGVADTSSMAFSSIFDEIEYLRSLPAAVLTKTYVGPNPGYDVVAVNSKPWENERRPLEAEILHARNEYIGSINALFMHHCLVIFLRRHHDSKGNFKTFLKLWSHEHDYLIKHLNTRWLISACDTIADHSPSKAERAVALLASTMVNTIKLYETERIFKQGYRRADGYDAYQWTLIFDGISTFGIGHGDVVFNMKNRLDRLCKTGSLAERLLLEVFKRVNHYDTAFCRFRDVHELKKTIW